jgi:fatty acid desaturase
MDRVLVGMTQAIVTAHRPERIRSRHSIEWRTLALIFACYGAWLVGGMLYAIAPAAAIALLAMTIALHSSLQHEAIHRHPTANAGWNEALVFLPIGLLVPFRRYRDLHLRHHADTRLTDPYDDPESYYLAFYDYQRLPLALRTLLRWNNMLVVRMLIGPAISTAGFLLTEARATLRPRDREDWPVRRAWALHAVGLIAVAGIVHFGFGMPVVAYLASAYLALSLLAIRSFCEHQWAETPDGRTVIVERSLLGLLFLNNNIHLVHHKHPGLPWYELPAAYRARRAEWQSMNQGYVFSSYAAVLRDFGLSPKEPVAHPVREGR